MQARKHNWKKIRETIPCRWCGEHHRTGDCPTYNKQGKRKQAEERWAK